MIEMQVKNLPMQQAYVNTFAKDGIQGDYNVISKDQKPLGIWPKSLGDKGIHPMLKFNRKVEMSAYLCGRKDEEIKVICYINEMKKRYEKKISDILIANEQLANKLSEFIGEQED